MTTFSYDGPVANHVYSYLAIDDDKHNSRNSNQTLLNDKDRKSVSKFFIMYQTYADIYINNNSH